MAEVLIKQGNKVITANHFVCTKDLIRGLMFKNKGNALLEFKKPGKYAIWMLFMKYSLNLYFIDASLKIVDKQHAEPITLNPRTWKIYKGKKPYLYVLEVDARQDPNFEFKNITMELKPQVFKTSA